jgi:hypothetical protein
MTGDKNAAANTDEFASHRENHLAPATGINRSEAEVTHFGVQQGEPLNGASV